MFTYRNTSDHDLSITNVGVCPAGQTIKSDTELNHPNLELVTTKKERATDKQR